MAVNSIASGISEYSTAVATSLNGVADTVSQAIGDLGDAVPITGASTSSVVASYSGVTDDSRLTEVVSSDATGDLQRLAYIKLEAPDGAYDDFPSDMNEDRAVMTAILSEIKSKYQKFILTGIGITNQEKTQVMPTFGDAFAATFTGKEPLVLGVSGNLIFDYSGDGSQSWFHAFLNAYEYYLRGSRLAKWKAKMKIVIPDLVEYTGYMMNLTTQMTSDNDQIIPMQFSFLVSGQTIFKSTVTFAESSSTRDQSGAVVGSNEGLTTQYDSIITNDDGSQYGVTPSGDVIPIQSTTPTATISSQTRVIGSATNSMINSVKQSAGMFSTALASTVNGAVNPANILKAATQNAFRTATSSILSQTSGILAQGTTSGFAQLSPKLDEYILKNLGRQMVGSVLIKATKSIPGLLGSKSVSVSTVTNRDRISITPVGKRASN